jgi:hypothetical protein
MSEFIWRLIGTTAVGIMSILFAGFAAAYPEHQILFGVLCAFAFSLAIAIAFFD